MTVIVVDHHGDGHAVCDARMVPSGKSPQGQICKSDDLTNHVGDVAVVNTPQIYLFICLKLSATIEASVVMEL